MPSPGPFIKRHGPKPDLPAKPEIRQRDFLIHASDKNKSARRSVRIDEFDGESTLSGKLPGKREIPRMKPGRIVNANGVSLRETTQEILARQHQQLLSASLILKSAKPAVPPKPSPRPSSSIQRKELDERPKEDPPKAAFRPDGDITVSKNEEGGNNSKATIFASFFHRITSLRRSFSRGDNRTKHSSSSSYNHQDWTFFRGFGGKSVNDLQDDNVYAEIDENGSHHGRFLTIPSDVPIAPPRRKRPRSSAHLRRSLSFTDAHYIAQAVAEGDGSLIRELYPNFPLSEPVYAVVDFAKKKRHRRTLHDEDMGPYRIVEPNIYEECRPPSEKSRPSSARHKTDVGAEDDSNVRKIMLESPCSGGVSVDFYCPREPSPVISPWNRTDVRNNLIIDCSSSTPPSSKFTHPYAQRTASHYESQEDDGVRREHNDSFQKILDTADSSILQAESILSSLRISRNEDEMDLKISDKEDDEMSSDIETNIRKLEMTQAKINAALETFRLVQQKKRELSEQQDPGQRTPVKGRRNAKHLSKTAPAKMERKTDTSVVETSSSCSIITEQTEGMEAGSRPKRSGIFRRHSFSLQLNKDKVTPTSTWYDGDVESDNGQSSHVDQESGYSDTEGVGGIRRRIRGLFGSFGKGNSTSNSVFYTAASTNGTSKKSDKGTESTSIIDYLREPGPSETFTQSVGEFTRRMESLNHHNDDGNNSNYYSAKSSSSSSTSSSSSSGGKPDQSYSRMKYHQSLAKNDSNDTFTSSLSSHNSNRHSVISGQSLSSESYEHDEDDDSEEETKDPSSSASSSGLREDGDEDPDRRREKQVFFIAREIMTSERIFVDVLRLLNVEFREFVRSRRRNAGGNNGRKRFSVIPEADLVKIFSNLTELQALNEDLLVDFEERIRNWQSSQKIADVIVKKGPFLKLYTTYIREFSSVNVHFDECLSRYPKFAKIVREFEALERCRNLKIKHFMLKPVQRLPQYKLLLEDYLKHLDPVRSQDFDDTTNALRIVSEAAEHANDTIRQGDKFRKMLKLQSRLGDLELIRPGRDLIKEGELQKISRKGINPRYFILLSDVLLYTTYTSGTRSESSGLRVSYTIPLNTLSVRVLPHYETEFAISSPVRSCTLRASSVSERNEWIEALSTGIEEHRNRKATFSAAPHHQHPSLQHLEDQRRLDVVGNCAPVWIPDRRVTMCQNCTVEFSVLVRRHHCRACGKVVCASCSGNKAPLRYREFESGRVCDECFDSLERELGHIENLKNRFKRRHHQDRTSSSSSSYSLVSHGNGRYVPPRLKVRAHGEGAQMSGYLKRRTPKNGKWKGMWFVLKDRVLYAYRASEDTIATETFPVLGFSLDTLSDKNFELYEGESADLVFQLTHAGSEPLVFCAENDNVSEKWITALREAVKFNPGDTS